jgi:hypothetical protein
MEQGAPHRRRDDEQDAAAAQRRRNRSRYKPLDERLLRKGVSARGLVIVARNTSDTIRKEQRYYDQVAAAATFRPSHLVSWACERSLFVLCTVASSHPNHVPQVYTLIRVPRE